MKIVLPFPGAHPQADPQRVAELQQIAQRVREKYTMPDYDDYEITEAMMTYGGGFVADLGALFRRGDPVNQARLKAAFPEYFREYAELLALSTREDG